MGPLISPNLSRRIVQRLAKPILVAATVTCLSWLILMDLQGRTTWALTAGGCLTVAVGLLAIDRSEQVTSRRVRKRTAQTLRWDLAPRSQLGLGRPLLDQIEKARKIVCVLGSSEKACAEILSTLGHEAYELGWFVLVDDDIDASTGSANHPLLEQWRKEDLGSIEHSGRVKYPRLVIIKCLERLPTGRLEAWQRWMSESLSNHVVFAGDPRTMPPELARQIETLACVVAIDPVTLKTEQPELPAISLDRPMQTFARTVLVVDVPMITTSSRRQRSRIFLRVSLRMLLWLAYFTTIAVVFDAPGAREILDITTAVLHGFFTVSAISWVAIRLAWPETYPVRPIFLLVEAICLFIALTVATSFNSLFQASLLVLCYALARLLTDKKSPRRIKRQSFVIAGVIVVVWLMAVIADSSALLIAIVYLLCTFLNTATSRFAAFTLGAICAYGLDVLQNSGLGDVVASNGNYRVSVILGLLSCVLIANFECLRNNRPSIRFSLIVVLGLVVIWYLDPPSEKYTQFLSPTQTLTVSEYDLRTAVTGWLFGCFIAFAVLRRLRIEQALSRIFVGIIGLIPIVEVGSPFGDFAHPDLLRSIVPGGIAFAIVLSECAAERTERMARVRILLSGFVAALASLTAPMFLALAISLRIGWTYHWGLSAGFIRDASILYVVAALHALAVVCSVAIIWALWELRKPFKAVAITRLDWIRSTAVAKATYPRLCVGALILLMHAGRNSDNALVTNQVFDDLSFADLTPIQLTVRIWPFELSLAAIIWAGLALSMFEWAYRLRGAGAGIAATGVLILFPGNATLVAVSTLVLIGSPRDVLSRRHLMPTGISRVAAVLAWAIIALGVTYQTADPESEIALVVLAALPIFLPGFAALLFLGAKRPPGGSFSLRHDYVKRLRRRVLSVVVCSTTLAALMASTVFGSVMDVVGLAVLPCLIDIWLVLHLAVIGSLSARWLGVERAARDSVRRLRQDEAEGVVSMYGAHCVVRQPKGELVT